MRDDDITQLGLRLIGVRKIASGIGLLVSRRPTGWQWGRVAGDAMDLALHGPALSSEQTYCGRDANRVNALAGLAALVGITALDVWCALRLTPARMTPTVTLVANSEAAYR